MGGTFILRIEDTDRTRYVEGAEEYIMDALKWCGMETDENVVKGGDYGPYRQSDRKPMYAQYAEQLVKNGHAYYAYDTPEEINQMREDLKTAEDPNPKYNYASRGKMKNTLSLSESEIKALDDAGAPRIIRLKVEPGAQITFNDIVRGEVTFDSKEIADLSYGKYRGRSLYGNLACDTRGRMVVEYAFACIVVSWFGLGRYDATILPPAIAA